MHNEYNRAMTRPGGADAVAKRFPMHFESKKSRPVAAVSTWAKTRSKLMPVVDTSHVSLGLPLAHVVQIGRSGTYWIDV